MPHKEAARQHHVYEDEHVHVGNGSLHVDMLARMMQMLMNEDFVEKLKAARTPAEFLALIDAQEERCV